MKRYRIREGSIVAYAIMGLTGLAFWGLIIMAALSAYPA